MNAETKVEEKPKPTKAQMRHGDYRMSDKQRQRIGNGGKGLVKRFRPASVEDTANDFLAVVLAHFAEKKITLNRQSVPQVPVLFRNYCSHKKLRGSEKAKVWCNVRRQLQEAFQAVTSDSQEL